MRQKLKKDWIQLSNKFQSEIDLDFIDNSIDMLQDSKYYLNSSNILPNIDLNNYNTNYDKLPLINKKENFYQSQINLNSNYNDKNNFKSSLKNKNMSVINFVESNNNFYIKDHKRTNGKSQKLNFNSIYQYNLKSENDLIEKIKNRDRENFLNNNNQQNSINQKINNKSNNFYETAFNSNGNNYKIKNNTLYLANNNNQNQNDITYINMNNNNSAGFKFNSSGEHNYIYANLTNIKLDLYDLGQLLIYCIIGGFDLINLTDYECLHTRSENCCCLLHCYFKYETESKKNFKLKLKEIFKKFNFSHHLENFICSLTNFKLDKNINIENIKEHLWLSDIKNINSFNIMKKVDTEAGNNKENEKKKSLTNYINKNILVDFEELFKLACEINSKGSIVNNNNLVKKFEKFFDSFNITLPKAINYIKHYNMKNYSQIINKSINLEYISKEINIDKDYLNNKLKTIFNNFFERSNSFKKDNI